MKTVAMLTDYDYAAHPRKMVRFYAGVTYARVIEAAAREIERAGAGRVVVSQAFTCDAVGDPFVDAGHAFRPRYR